MVRNLCYERTEKGHAELFSGKRTLRPRERQILFVVGDASCMDEVKQQICGCPDFEHILKRLVDEGYVRPTQQAATAAAAAPATAAQPLRIEAVAAQSLDSVTPENLEAARQHLLGVLTSFVGTRSPVYAKVQASQEARALLEALAASKKVLAAVSCASTATTAEEETLALLCPKCSAGPVPGQAAGMPAATLAHLDNARKYLLESLGSLLGARSPYYAKIEQAQTEEDLVSALAACKRIIASVASATHAANMENEALARLRAA